MWTCIEAASNINPSCIPCPQQDKAQTVAVASAGFSCGLQWSTGRGTRWSPDSRSGDNRSPSSRALFATHPAEQCRTAGNSFSHELFRAKVSGFRARRVFCLCKRLLQRFSCFESFQTKIACTWCFTQGKQPRLPLEMLAAHSFGTLSSGMHKGKLHEALSNSMDVDLALPDPEAI